MANPPKPHTPGRGEPIATVGISADRRTLVVPIATRDVHAGDRVLVELDNGTTLAAELATGPHERLVCVLPLPAEPDACRATIRRPRSQAAA